ncbi:MAG: hypothetical protein WDA02_08060 [Saccharofermentanales bacterium]|jgi:hypothetical protein
MDIIKKFDEFNIFENIKLTDDEKKYLWSKLEYRKKKTAIEQENELFNLLNSDKKSYNNDEFNLILNSLEYKFRKKLKRQDTPLDNDNFMSISDKIPDEWVGIKYSSIDAKKRKDKK